MKIMYPAQVNSPGTELAAAIDAAQDTILVADGSVLPEGPNLLTIGTDEAAETIVYTGRTGDELTGVTRGFQGTAQSWVAGTKVARYFTAYDHDAAISNISELSTGLNVAWERLDIEERKDVVLNAGMQILNAQRRAAFSLRGIKGRTLVNLIGRDGAFESVNPWSAYSVKGPPTVANNEITVIGSGEATNPQIGRNLRAAPAPKVGDKMFIRAIAKTKNACESLRAYLYISSPVGTRHGEIIISSPTVDKPYALYKSFTVTQQLVDNWGTTGLVLVAQHTSAAAATDTVAVYSQAALYVVATEDLGLTDDELAAKYTYVNSVQPVRNPYAIRYGENLLPPFYEWSWGAAEVKVVEPYTATLNRTGAGQNIFADVQHVSGAIYTFSCVFGANSVGQVQYYGADGNAILQEDLGEVKRIAPPQGTVRLRILLAGANGLLSFKNPMLTLDTEAKAFKPREDSMLALQTDLYADPLTGSNADEVFEKDGQYFKLAKWKKRVYGESDAFSYWASQPVISGRKVVFMPMVKDRDISKNPMAVKYDGKLLKVGSPSEAVDTISIVNWQNTSENNLGISVSNTDSGWGDNYTPTTDEIKAYFMGWYMGDSSSTWGPYNGTGSKGWIPRNNTGDLVQGVSVGSVPTTPSSYGFTPYQLVYQLATPTVEPIVFEGMLTFNEGDNQIEIGTGMVVREPMTIAKAGANATTNDTGTTSPTPFKNRVKTKINIYRDGKVDAGWTFNSVSAYGLEKYYRPYTEYDQSAAYSVTYLMLDTSPIVPFIGSYAANEKSMLQELTDSVQQNATAVSVLMHKKADKDQPAWITPTLLNGWVPYSNTYNEPQYYKDSLGYVHLRGLMKSGSSSAAVFVLPTGYRPRKWVYLSALTKSGTTLVATTLEIRNDGVVYISGGAGTDWFQLDGASFLAEQ